MARVYRILLVNLAKHSGFVVDFSRIDFLDISRCSSGAAFHLVPVMPSSGGQFLPVSKLLLAFPALVTIHYHSTMPLWQEFFHDPDH
jgi:hypothetical protein